MKNERNKSGMTECIYETDSMVFEFEAEVIESFEIAENESDKRYGIVLTRTAFFPEGGGQQADEGLLNDVRISDVQTDDEGRIVHFASENINVGTIVRGQVNRDLRFRRMQNHSAEHIVSGIIHSEYGYNNTGFHMMDVGLRLDCDGPLTEEQIKNIERRANEVVFKNVPVTVSFPSKEEARNMDYRSKLDIEEGIRIVTIEGVDTCACCAPHVTMAGQIGIIKIIDAVPHRGGMRITMLAGMDAYEDYVVLDENNAKIMAILSAKRHGTAAGTEDFYGRTLRLKEENTSLKKEMSGFVTKNIMSELSSRASEDETPLVIFTEVLDQVGLRNLINECTKKYSILIAGFIGNDEDGYKYVMGCKGNCDLKLLCSDFNREFGAGGGGSNEMVSGSVKAGASDIENYLKNYNFASKC